MSKIRVHFTRDHIAPVCGAYGRNPNATYVLTSNPAYVTCRRRECQQEAGASETYSPWRDDYADN